MAQEYLINKSNELNNTNAKIMDDIQNLSAFPLDPNKLAKVSQNIDGYGTSLYYSNIALSVLNKNSNLFTANEISTFSRNLSNAINNLSQLQGCSTKSYNGILCNTASTSGNGSSSDYGIASGTSNGSTSNGSSVVPEPAAPPRQQNPYNDPDNLTALQAGLLTFTGGNREFFQGYSSFSNIYRGMPIIEGLAESEMRNEKTLITQLNTFNEKYARYLKCNDKWNNSDCAASEICIDPLNPNKNINVINCTPLRDIVDSASNINRSVANLKNASINMGTGKINKGDYNIPAGSALTPEEYETNYKLILDNHNKISKLRNELDVKIQMLYNPEKSVNTDYKKSFDATIYSGILISALATSILFYTFNQL